MGAREGEQPTVWPARALPGERLQVEVVAPGRDLAVFELEDAQDGQVEGALAVALAEVLEALDGHPPLVGHDREHVALHVVDRDRALQEFVDRIRTDRLARHRDRKSTRLNSS